MAERVLVTQATKDGAPFVRQNYKDILREHGLIPEVIHYSDTTRAKEHKKHTAAGLLLTGGLDVYPGIYGGVVRKDLSYDPDRDEFTLSLLQWAEENKVPITGFCQGLQIAGIFHNARLKPDLQTYPINHGNGQNGYDDLIDRKNWHEVTIVPGTKTGIIYQSKQRVLVASSHHQAIDPEYVGNVTVTATADDGVIEAIEVHGNRYVQWHPEVNDPTLRAESRPLIAAFASDVREYALAA